MRQSSQGMERQRGWLRKNTDRENRSKRGRGHVEGGKTKGLQMEKVVATPSPCIEGAHVCGDGREGRMHGNHPHGPSLVWPLSSPPNRTPSVHVPTRPSHLRLRPWPFPPPRLSPLRNASSDPFFLSFFFFRVDSNVLSHPLDASPRAVEAFLCIQ